MPSERQVSLAEFQQHLNNLKMPRAINEVIVHHTWSPTAAQYRGIATVAGVRRYHMHVRGWSDNGYHVMIGPPGDLFLCRPIERTGAHCLGHNGRSVGVSFIANFDVENPAAYAGLEVGYRVVAALLGRFDLGTGAIHFHREFADKTCPGLRLDLTAFRQEVAKRTESAAGADLRIVLLPGSKEIACRARLEGEVTRADLRPLAEGLGYEVLDRIREEGKVYVRGVVGGG